MRTWPTSSARSAARRSTPSGPSRLEETAQAFEIEALGQLPIDPKIAEACDTGTFEDELPAGTLSEAVDTVVRVAEFVDALRGQDA